MSVVPWKHLDQMYEGHHEAWIGEQSLALFCGYRRSLATTMEVKFIASQPSGKRTGGIISARHRADAVLAVS